MYLTYKICVYPWKAQRLNLIGDDNSPVISNVAQHQNIADKTAMTRICLEIVICEWQEHTTLVSDVQ